VEHSVAAAAPAEQLQQARLAGAVELLTVGWRKMVWRPISRRASGGYVESLRMLVMAIVAFWQQTSCLDWATILEEILWTGVCGRQCWMNPITQEAMLRMRMRNGEARARDERRPLPPLASLALGVMAIWWLRA
jgi:hypothetical protein